MFPASYRKNELGYVKQIAFNYVLLVKSFNLFPKVLVYAHKASPILNGGCLSAVNSLNLKGS